MKIPQLVTATHLATLLRSVAITATTCIQTVNGQWCVPATAIPYNANMPGITRFVCNTIDRSSMDIENFPNNSYVLTGLSTTLVRGNSYPVTIEFTIDANICPDMNLRIWIDLNHDGQLDDSGETLLSADHVLPSSYNGTITIPSNAMTGTTRMRAAVKMSDLGGHILPTPCDLPPDPFGFHGELEDYNVTVTDAVGIGEALGNNAPQVIFDESNMTLSIRNGPLMEATLMAFDAQGRTVISRSLNGGHPDNIPLGSLVPGVYVAQLIWAGRTIASRFVVHR